jgi:glutathione S-transferase
VRRVAISLDRLGLAFEHRNWSVGSDFDRIRQHSPLGRVPVLVTDAGEALTESSMILEHLDDLVGPERALMPATGAERRAALGLIGLATGAVDKGIQIVIERIFRPAEKRHEPYVDRCCLQMRGALSELDKACAAAAEREWLVGDRLGQADISFTCFSTYVREAVPHPLEEFPALAARNARYEALPLFAKYYIPFDAPVPA